VLLQPHASRRRSLQLTVLLADSLLLAAFCTALMAASSWISPVQGSSSTAGHSTAKA
jgi:hypothetical protein